MRYILSAVIIIVSFILSLREEFEGRNKAGDHWLLGCLGGALSTAVLAAPWESVSQ